jgi:Concanavalin A-like lectin/glucanases superfamily
VSVLLVFPNGLAEIRRVPVDHYLAGTRRYVSLELLAEEDHATVPLAAEAAGWLEVSLNGGASWTPLGTDPETGLEVGPMSAGDRLQVLVAVNTTVPFRQRRIPILIGLGTGLVYELVADLPLFARASVAYDLSGAQVASGVPRFASCKFGDGILIEEGAINLLTANEASFETDVSMIGSYNATVSRDTSVSLHGAASCKYVGDSTSYCYIYTSAAVSEGETYSASLWFKGTAGTQLAFQVQYLDSGYGYLDGQVIVATATGDWQRAAVTRLAPAGTAHLLFSWASQTAGTQTFYIDCLQVEQNAYATTWQLPGAARDGEALSLPKTAVSAPEGTFEAWVKLVTAINVSDNCLFNPASTPLRDLRLSLNNAGHLYVAFGTGSGSLTATGTHVIAVGELHHVALTWGPAGVSIYLDGALEAHNSAVPALTIDDEPALGSELNIGSQFNGLIEDVRLDGVALTAGRIALDYACGGPVPTLPTTLYKLPLDGNLNPANA